MSKEPKSLVEKIRAKAGKGGYSVLTDPSSMGIEVDGDRVYIHGCDCSEYVPPDKVREMYELLGTYLRMQRNKARG